MGRWQHQWDRGQYGRTTHEIIQKVNNKSHNWPRQLTQFITGHGPFPVYLHRFGKHQDNFCACGQEGSPFHYAPSLHPFTSNVHSKDTKRHGTHLSRTISN
ncbi:hypothetical protein AVEN_84349-1 [Araneus ventricosus]|uniref:Uncharacterized protein n=1 Tax=Araneus ventricosus TaxID=182803 RepID=A0A4Y2RXE3_ARAVE|nr:hypothetical protein AVEN_84349-1 [Araneus ventricosus]